MYCEGARSKDTRSTGKDVGPFGTLSCPLPQHTALCEKKREFSKDIFQCSFSSVTLKRKEAEEVSNGIVANYQWVIGLLSAHQLGNKSVVALGEDLDQKR